MKTCIKCEAVKALEAFSKNGHGEKRRNTCKTCQAEYRREYYSKNKDRENRDCRSYKKTNKGKVNALNNKRHKRIKQSKNLLSAFEERQIERIYKKCAEYRDMGLNFHVDHIVPLNGKTVSGLYVPWNLRITTAELNYKKRNIYERIL